MSVDFNIKAQSRADLGKGASRRLRHQGFTPAIIYGGHQDPQAITLNHNEVIQHIEHEAFFSHILNLEVDGKSEQVVLRDMQRHPAKRQIMHMDFLRVSAREKLRMHVPLHFINEDSAPGVKAGGMVSHLIIEVEVTCLPADLPEYIEIDMGSVEIGGSVHLSDIKLPDGVELVELSHGEDHDQAIASVQVTRASVEDEVDENAAESAESEDEGAD